MKLIDQKYNVHLGKYEKTWLADAVEEITADFDPDSAAGSSIMVISTGDFYMKNTVDKWQKVGTTEVV